ncbi:adhesion G protein-coupled receptor B2-like isoform X2 [Alosa sapidissima]|uniref:adhesion G protein-coupled receptor B2-like isoform X2 n=1 Tax=Alosa sapidissima TaxID=34773 RepID=UPI001C08F7CD|nr:adhesion G protein-coupled receptor B2-like isoform X2 [Alosa sapidissima]
MGVNLNRSYSTLKQLPNAHHANAHHANAHAHATPHAAAQAAAAGGRAGPGHRGAHTLSPNALERTRNAATQPGQHPRPLPGLPHGSLERKRVRYSELDFEKVMHTRKRHSELYHELNHSSKFHTLDRYNRDPAMSTFKEKSTADDQHSWDSFKSMTPDPTTCLPGDQSDHLELHNKTWDATSANTPDTSEGDFQTEV